MVIELIRQCQRQVFKITVIRSGHDKRPTRLQCKQGVLQQFPGQQKVLDHLNSSHRIVSANMIRWQRGQSVVLLKVNTRVLLFGDVDTR